MRSRSRLLSAVLAVGALLITSCATSASAPSAAPSASGAAVTVDNCGFRETIAAPPKRIVTIKSTSTELLLALGLGDRIVGDAFQDGPLPAQWKQQGAGIRSLSDFVPSQEAVLGLEPDMVYAGWESNLTASGAGDRSTLHTLGVSSYVSPAACKEAGFQPAKLTFEDLFGEFTEAGRVFGAQHAAAELVATQRAQLAEVKPDARKPTALWYSSGDDTPYVGAGIGAPQMVMDAVGLTNIAAGVHDTWTSLSWESIVAANPDVIVLVDATWNTAAAKEQALAANPATANLAAVQHHRYLILPFPASEAGVRSVPAVADLSAQLAKLDLR